MTYPFTFYVDSIAPDVAGRTNGPIIRIDKRYKDDEGLLTHELVHVKQWFTLFLMGVLAALIMYFAPTSIDPSFWWVPVLIGSALHGLMYKFYKGYRLWCEVQAYKEQALYYSDDRRELFAGFIAEHYNLGISKEQAYLDLNGVNK